MSSPVALFIPQPSLLSEKKAVSFQRLKLCLFGVVLICLSACDEKKPAPEVSVPSAAPSVAPPVPCGDGKSEDPSVSEFKPAQVAFREKKYERARGLLSELAEAHPHSASVRVWQGDAVLFDPEVPLVEAADQSLVYYDQASKLVDEGCGLAEYERYYWYMGYGYAYLRKKDGKAALQKLKLAEKEFQDSAGIYYNIARAYCREDDVAQCANYFAKTLETAKAQKRPSFLRTHYSLASWISRSRTQSEFVKLRREKRYRDLLAQYQAG